MGLSGDLRNMTRLARGLRSYLRRRLSIHDAREIIRQRFDQREANFLGMVERGIFDVPTSPYLPLLAQAGCQFADVRSMVRTRGVEATLRALRDAGVFVTFEEFKGRRRLVRGGVDVAVTTSDFANPSRQHHYWTESGGSTGAGTRVSTDLAKLADTAPYLMIANDAHGLTGAPKAIWRGLLPAGAAINYLLASAITGDVPSRWFTPIAPRDLTSSRKYPLATYSILALSRLSGARLPWPTRVGLDRADIVARWAASAAAEHGRCHVSTSASMALRACLAAAEAGLDLTGVCFSGGGEPMTPAKARGIEQTGARCRPTYFSTETGPMGMSCGHPTEPNDQHLLEDAVALIQSPHEVASSGRVVDAFNVTCLLPSSTHVMLNVELDDYGVVEQRSCACAFEALGLTTHIRRIRSFRKLTGEGVTLVGSDMERILEDVLPAAFGGSPLDYQLTEEEDADGRTRISLVVSPRVAVADEAAVIDTVMRALAGSGAGADHARASWQLAGTLRVRRAEPAWTDRGKLQPLHLNRSRLVVPEPDHAATGPEHRA